MRPIPGMISLLVLFQDDLSGFFADHIHRTGNKKSWNSRKYRGVHNAQPLHAAHAKVAGQHLAYRASTRSVMTPGIRSDKFAQFGITGQMVAGQFFFGDEALPLERRSQLAYETDAVHHRIQVLVASLGKVTEVDHRRIARVARSQRDLAGVVT